MGSWREFTWKYHKESFLIIISRFYLSCLPFTVCLFLFLCSSWFFPHLRFFPDALKFVQLSKNISCGSTDRLTRYLYHYGEKRSWEFGSVAFENICGKKAVFLNQGQSHIASKHRQDNTTICLLFSWFFYRMIVTICCQSLHRVCEGRVYGYLSVSVTVWLIFTPT